MELWFWSVINIRIVNSKQLFNLFDPPIDRSCGQQNLWAHYSILPDSFYVPACEYHQKCLFRLLSLTECFCILYGCRRSCWVQLTFGESWAGTLVIPLSSLSASSDPLKCPRGRCNIYLPRCTENWDLTQRLLTRYIVKQFYCLLCYV